VAPCFSALGFRLARRALDIPSVEQQALETPCADRLMSVLGRLCCKTILSAGAKNIFSRSATNAEC
jgi:hypothetical protein